MNKELSYQEKTVFYRVTGQGEPVVLVHGFGEDGEIWRPLLSSPLLRKYSFIIPDLPGSGRSPMIADMSMEGLAAVIIAMMDKEKIETCPIIGHSMGGYITMALAEKYPNRLSGLGLFHSSAFTDSEEKKATRRKGIGFINQHGAFEFLKTSIPNLFSPTTRDENPEFIDQLLSRADNFSAPALVSYYEAMIQRPDRTHILRETTVPVLFIMGKFDAAVPVEDALKQCHLPGKSYIHMLRKSGHMGMLEETAKAAAILDEFLLEN